MATIHKALPLGGGAGLNFKVVGSVTEPKNPKENTIWVKTSESISAWSLDAIAPDYLSDRDVWIEIDNSSDVDFNGLKENAIYIYPKRLLQWIKEDSIWTNRNAYIYQNGSWVIFNRETAESLLENGALNTDFINSFSNGLSINAGTGGDTTSSMSGSTTTTASNTVDLSECTGIKIMGIVGAACSCHGGANMTGTFTLTTSSGTHTIATSYEEAGGSEVNSNSAPFEKTITTTFSSSETLKFTASYSYYTWSGSGNGNVSIEITDIYLIK